MQDDDHLIQCTVYIDLNIVRAGVVQRPSQWPFSGYNKIQNPPQRYALIDRGRLMVLLGFDDSEQLREAYRGAGWKMCLRKTAMFAMRSDRRVLL